VKLGDAATPCGTVVGVVSDRRQSIQDPTAAADLYVPLGSPLLPPGIVDNFPGRQMAVLVAGISDGLMHRLSDVVSASVPSLTSIRVRTPEQLLDSQFHVWRLGAAAVGTFSLIAVVLVAIGVYGLVAHVVAQRARELSVRAAVGATAASLLMLIVKDALRMTIVGTGLGLVVAAGVTHFTRALMFGISPLDARVYIVAGLALVSASVLATIVPAIHAGRIAPALAMRAE
jgi:ABC-type antimicrobial peptide transport system permease subunit